MSLRRIKWLTLKYKVSEKYFTKNLNNFIYVQSSQESLYGAGQAFLQVLQVYIVRHYSTSVPQNIKCAVI
jgi:hypothetical protein